MALFDILFRFQNESIPDAAISKGKSIIKNKMVTIKNINLSEYSIDFKIESQTDSDTTYITHLYNLNTPYPYSSCDCPVGENCKHVSAAVEKLMTELGPFGTLETMQSRYPHTGAVAKAYTTNKAIVPRLTMGIIASLTTMVGLHRFSLSFSFPSFHQDLGTIEAEVVAATSSVSSGTSKSNLVKMNISRKGEIDSTCTCNTPVTPQQPLCNHRSAVLLRLLQVYGEDYLPLLFLDLTEEKNRLLAEYGYSLDDYPQNDFGFDIRGGHVSLMRKSASVQKINDPNTWQKFLRTTKIVLPEVEPTAILQDNDNRVVLFVLELKDFSERMPLCGLQIYSANVGKNGRYTTLRSLADHMARAQDMPLMSQEEYAVVRLQRNFDRSTFAKKALKSGYITDEFLNIPGFNATSPEAAAGLAAYEGALVEVLWRQLKLIPNRLYLTQSYSVGRIEDLQAISLSDTLLQPRFVVREENGIIILCAILNFGNEEVLFHEYKEIHSLWIWVYHHTAYRLSSLESGMLLLLLSKNGGKISVKRQGIEPFLEYFIAPLSEQHPIEFELKYPMVHTPWAMLEQRIYLKESDAGLRFVPAFLYEGGEDGMEVANNGGKSKVEYNNQTLNVRQRDTQAEEKFIELLEAQHPKFADLGSAAEYVLAPDELLQDGWFFQFNDTMKQHGVQIFGFSNLKKFKYNPNRAVIKVQASSGIDWFDLQISISFGDQMVSLADVKKAVANRKNYVQLADGTIGLLPEEWLNRYADALKLAQIRGDRMKVSKRHFMLMEMIREEIDSEEILRELDEKRTKLLNFREIPNVPLPATVNATLRNYQVEGYKWLHFLDEFTWGGLLADDMGLGKTLQVLSFLSEIKERSPNSMHLIVMPKSLIFNWQAEVEKFCPHLRILAYHGIERKKVAETFRQYDLILTTYGTMRSDIEDLKDIKFHYVVLDESQAIKNPNSQVSQAVRLLKAKNRIAMTGTPIENNTFDLWSQFEFLNPGFLGSAEFFREEFANPIDRSQNKDQAAALRRLVYPFMLKRTKEEVATDLPDKIESVIYCEMGDAQRKVYDSFREKYRVMLADKMAVDGREKSAFLILEGLLKLRQICDSPALLNDDEQYPDDSVKLDEIIREIQENTSNHKILIFSQFVKMLDLVRKHLEKEKIIYEYLDGQTEDRAARVERFQTDASCRVFLMSLKAGGVGLNLTEADYVYLIDPWWNPAVEAQAIDRTHRIGQTKAVFAYRMICKDTVEEKILKLQQKKQEIAGDIIDAEAGFLKKLSQDDVLGLFM